MKKVFSMLLTLVIALNCFIETAPASTRISINEREINSRSDIKYGRIIDLFRELELLSSQDDDINIKISIVNGSKNKWSIEDGLDLLKSYGPLGIDFLIPYGEKGLDFLKSCGDDGWEYLVSCAENGLNFLITCGQSGLTYLESQGGDGWEYLKRCGEYGLDFLGAFKESGLQYLKEQGLDGWEFLTSFTEAGMNFLTACGQAGLDYLESEGGDGWEYLQKCGPAALKLLKVCGKMGLRYLLAQSGCGFPFLEMLGDSALDLLLSYDEDGLNYLISRGPEGWNYIKSCGVDGLSFLKEYGQAGLDYIISNSVDGWNYLKSCDTDGLNFLIDCGNSGFEYITSFGQAGLNYLMSFGDAGFNFFKSSDIKGLINSLLHDIPTLNYADKTNKEAIWDFLKSYYELGLDFLKPYGENGWNCWYDYRSSRNNDTANEEIIEILSPGAFNISDASEVKRFLDAGSLEWIDFVSDFRDREYFKEGDLVFCREFPNSPSRYGFIDRDYLTKTIKNFYGGGFNVHKNSAFTFRLSASTILWNNTIKSTGESAFFSLKTLEPGKSGDLVNLGVRLLQTAKNNNRSAVRFFFSTNLEGVHVAAIIRDNTAPTYYIAANRPFLEKNSLVKTLMARERIYLNASMDDLTFYLWETDDRLKYGANLDTCLDIFIEQTLKHLEGSSF